MRINGQSATQRLEIASVVLGILGVVTLVASMALSAYLKFGHPAEALKHKLTAAAIGNFVVAASSLGLLVCLGAVAKSERPPQLSVNQT